jgi:hypothetical protein
MENGPWAMGHGKWNGRWAMGNGPSAMDGKWPMAMADGPIPYFTLLWTLAPGTTAGAACTEAGDPGTPAGCGLALSM